MNRDCFSREKCNGRGRKMVGGGGLLRERVICLAQDTQGFLPAEGEWKNIKTQEK